MSKIKSILKLLRIKQWIKNGFVLAPLLFSGQFVYYNSILQALMAMLLFCIGSSAVYIVNDIKDIENDKRHSKKSKSRPLASGDLSLTFALILLGVLYFILAIAWFWYPNLIYIIIFYILLNYFYTFKLKNIPVVDIFTIATGFVLRVYAGAVVLNVPLSGWMFITTLCLSLFLAAIKRKQELLQVNNEIRSVLKYYSLPLVNRYAQISSTGTLVFYSMYVMAVREDMIITIPLVLFGLFRYWYIVEQHAEGESPTDVLITDRWLQLVILLWISTCVIILYHS